MKYAKIPVKELEKLEDVRDRLWELFGIFGIDQNAVQICEFQKCTQVLFNIAHKKWEIIEDNEE